MPHPIIIVLLIVLPILVLLLFNLYRVQRAALSRIHHFISDLSQGQYSRRIDTSTLGAAEGLAEAANALAENLEAKAARAQQDSDHLLSLLAVLDHTNEIAIATDAGDTIRLANPAAATVLGRPAEQLVGKQVEAVIHQAGLLGLYKNAFHSAKPISAQITLQIPGRTLHCQATAATIYSGPHYRGTLLLLRDITELARTLQIKTDFVANASHELRTPLASIRAAVETIKESTTDDIDIETTRRCVDIINNHALRLQMMVTDLLDLSRAEDPRAVVRSDRIDLASVCDMVTGMYAGNAHDKNLQLRVNLAPDAKTIRGDERLLILCLKNLLDNAIKFTNTGSVTIRSYRAEGSPVLPQTPESLTPSLFPDASSPPPSIILEVEDTGCGIPPEDQQRVFERFYTVNRSRGGADRGTGLGLAIVKHAVAAMGGQVTLTSEPNKGTILRCHFPQRAVIQEQKAAS